MSAAVETALEEDLRIGRRVAKQLRRDGPSIAKEYGGRYVALDGSNVVAAADSAEGLEVALQRLKVEPDTVVIRWVPPPTARFVL